MAVEVGEVDVVSRPADAAEQARAAGSGTGGGGGSSPSQLSHELERSLALQRSRDLRLSAD
jgi:NAD(P)H-dependent flavin oxidoreductase YrpB (nitropropane dioxygenase family)